MQAHKRDFEEREMECVRESGGRERERERGVRDVIRQNGTARNQVEGGSMFH